NVLFMNVDDIAELGLEEGGTVTASTVANDGVVREVKGLVIVPYSIPRGAVGGYYPELNPLIPLWHHAKESKVPAAKSIPIRVGAEEKPSKGRSRWGRLPLRVPTLLRRCLWASLVVAVVVVANAATSPADGDWPMPGRD